VTAQGSILGTAGSSERAGVMIGHGGSEGYASTNSVGSVGDIRLRAETGDVIFLAGPGTQAWAQVGHGSYGNMGDHTGDISVIAPEGSIEFRWSATNTPAPGTLAYAQLGHGGNGAIGNHVGNIE